jgi:hypothetical protein
MHPTGSQRFAVRAMLAASIGGPRYPSLTIAILALDRIDFATGLQWLLYPRKAGPIARRTYMFGWFYGSLSHLNLSGPRLSWPSHCATASIP